MGRVAAYFGSSEVNGLDTMRRAWLLSGGMVAVAALAAAAKHRTDTGGVRADPPQLQTNIPTLFAGWRLLPEAPQVVNPQTRELLDKLYSEVVSRTYVDASPYAVMLSVAYGHDQRGGLEAHKPEICYPAQGFVLHDQYDHVFQTPYGAVQGRRLRATLGAREEPITYWFAVASTVAVTPWARRVAQFRSMLTGAIPDGILLRISSIDADPARAWMRHEQFITDMLNALPVATRERVMGPTTHRA